MRLSTCIVIITQDKATLCIWNARFPTSLTGETVSKKKARRRAREGEERSKLDIALDATSWLLPEMGTFEALVMDSWYTNRWFGYELSELNVPWIGQSDSKPKYQVGSHYLTTDEIYEAFKRRMKRVKGLKKGIRAVSIPATIRPDAYTKEAQDVQLVLVTGLHKKRDNEKIYKLLVCNQQQWSKKRIIRLFSYRPKIENVHRQGKQHEGWNEFHTGSVEALYAHLALSLLRSTIMQLMRVWEPELDKYSAEELINHVICCLALLTINSYGQIMVHFSPNYLATSLIIFDNKI